MGLRRGQLEQKKIRNLRSSKEKGLNSLITWENKFVRLTKQI